MTYDVTQEDREAAAVIFDDQFDHMLGAASIRRGSWDENRIVQAFAKHRTEATKELVEALRHIESVLGGAGNETIEAEVAKFATVRLSRATGGQS